MQHGQQVVNGSLGRRTSQDAWAQADGSMGFQHVQDRLGSHERLAGAGGAKDNVCSTA